MRKIIQFSLLYSVRPSTKLNCHTMLN